MPTPSANRLTIDPALVARFRGDVIALAVMPSPERPLALAVSGGPDSMAMLALAHAAFSGAAAAATIDHGLRPENAAEARMVADWCAGHGIPHRTMVAGDAPGPGENLHVWARACRYRLLHGWGERIAAAALATAHHADDQAETFVMRAARGAGLSGLAGVRTRLDEASDGARITTIRPLLGWRRAELRGIVAAAGVPFVDDPSNLDPRFDRARVRQWLGAPDAPDAAQIARSAGQLAQIDAELRDFARRLRDERALPAEGDTVRIDAAGLPRTLRRYLAGMIIDQVARAHGDGPVERNIESLLDALEAGSAATQNGVLASAKGDIWTFRPAPPRRTG